MKYTITLLAFLALASCEKKKDTYTCECTSTRGQIEHQYQKKYTKASDGVLACEVVQDSLAAVRPANAGIECFFYNNK